MPVPHSWRWHQRCLVLCASIGFANAQAHEKGRRSALSNDHLSCLLHQFLDDFHRCAAIAEELFMEILQHELAAQGLLALFAQVQAFQTPREAKEKWRRVQLS